MEHHHHEQQQPAPSHEHSGHRPGGHDKHAGHHADDFRKRFLVCLILSVPVLLLSHMIQTWLGFELGFPGDRYVLACCLLSSFSMEVILSRRVCMMR